MLITITGKVSDLFSLTTDEGNIDYDGYVPYGLGIGDGDYIEMDIDTETGQIQNWKPYGLKELKSALAEARGDEDDEYDWDKD